MVTLAIDGTLSAAEQIRDLMIEIDPDGAHYAGDDPVKMQKLAFELKPDVIWLEVAMPGGNGLGMAAEIRRILPDTNVVIVTDHLEYAIDAFRMHVSGFIVKPATKERLLDEVINARIPIADHGYESQLTIQCFGNFEVFCRNKIVKFKRSLSKEAFAYLVDRRGAGCTVGEICSILWEERTADKGLKSQCRVIMGALKKDLEKIGAGDVLVKNWNTWGIDTSKVECDYYNFLKTNGKEANSFNGEYMSQYSWAEMTVGRLFGIAESTYEK